MIASLVAFTCLAFAQAETSPANVDDAVLRSQVRRYLRQIDHRELEMRNAAEKSLIELGPRVLTLLPAITPRTSAEFKERLGRVRKTLELAAAEAATHSSEITLQGEMTFAEAMQALEKQSGNHAAGYDNYSGTVTVNADKAPYWKVLDEVLDQVNLTADPYGGRGDAVNIRARPEDQLPRAGRASYNGVYRFEALRIDAVRDLRNPQINGLRLTMLIEWEPRVRPIGISQPLDALTITAENGDALAVDEGRRTLSALVQNEIPSTEMTIPLSLPPRSVEKIATLKGSLTTLAPGRVESFEFTGIETAKLVEQQRGGVTVTFERLSRNGQIWGARVLVRFDKAANALESHRNWIFSNPAYIIDSTGEQIDFASFETTRQAENEVGVEYYFDLENGPEDCTFVYKTPAAIVKRQIEYTLSDIPLP